MAVLILPAGILIAPLLTAVNQLIAQVAPPGMMTEAYAWPTTALVIGLAAGSGVSGVLVQSSGWRASIAAITVGAVVSGIVALTRRRTLIPVPA
jgi:MFS family permease